MQTKDQALSQLKCAPFRGRIEKTRQKAGYGDLKAFYLMDIRMHLAIQMWARVSIAKLVGQVSDVVTVKLFCDSEQDIARVKDPKAVKQKWQRIQAYKSYLSKASKALVAIAQKLLNDSDIAIIGKHIKEIDKALFNPALVDDFRHVEGGGDFD